MVGKASVSKGIASITLQSANPNNKPKAPPTKPIVNAMVIKILLTSAVQMDLKLIIIITHHQTQMVQGQDLSSPI